MGERWLGDNVTCKGGNDTLKSPFFSFKNKTKPTVAAQRSSCYITKDVREYWLSR